MNTVNRGWLKKQCLLGNLFVKCEYRLTDDYAGDAASNFGKMDEYAQAYIKPEFPKPEGYDSLSYNEQSALYSAWSISQRQEGKVCFYESDFRGKCGGAYAESDKNKGRFYLHSNLSYSYEIRQAEAKQAA